MSPATKAIPASASPATQDIHEWVRKYKSPARRSLVVLGARIRPEWLNRTVGVVEVSFVGDLGQALSDLVSLASAKKKYLPTVRLKASMALSLDGIIVIDRHLGLQEPRPAISLHNEELEAEEVAERIRKCLKTWSNDVLQSWAQANGLAESAERLAQAIRTDGIQVRTTEQPLINRPAGARLGRPAYHLIARRLAEELVGATLFEGFSPVDMVVDPSDTSASVELLTQPVRMGNTKHMFSMAARLSVFTMPNSRDLFVKVTPVKRIWTSEMPGRKPNAPANIGCTIMVPGKPFLTVRACQVKGNQAAGEGKAPAWAFSDEYEEFLARAKGMLPETLQEAVAQVAPDPSNGGWWVGFPRLTTVFDRVGGRTVFECDEYDLHETVVQLLPATLDSRLEWRSVKAIGQKAAAKDTHKALKPSDIGYDEEASEPGRAGQSLSDDNLPDDERPVRALESDRAGRLEVGRAANVAALQALHPGKPVHLFVFGGEPNEQAIIRACADVLFGDAVQVHTEALPLHTHGLKDELEKSDAKSLVRFDARVNRWTQAFAQLPQDGGVRHVMVCADRMIGRRTEDQVNYYAAIHAACSVAGANVHHVLPIQQKRGKDDVGHFVHRVQSAMLDVFLAHSGVVLGVRDLVEQTLGLSKTTDKLPRYVCGVQTVRSRARRFSGEENVSFILYSRLSLVTGLVDIKIACRLGKKDTTTDWMPLATGLRWLGSQRNIASDERWLRDAFQPQTRAMLSQLKSEDERAIVLLDWQRLGGLWQQVRDDLLSESPPGSMMLGTIDLSIVCPGMTFMRLRSTRESSMTIRTLTTKLYEGWTSRPQGLEATGEVYTERYLTAAHEILEVIASDAQERVKPGRTSNRHYLQVMRNRDTMQLLRGFSCYRTTERMKAIDESGENGKIEGSAQPTSKRFRIVQLAPMHDDATLATTMECTIITGPAELDPDQVVRLVMGLRLRFAHYPDWTALPAPLFFISKVDDYVIRYADLARQDEDGQDDEAEANSVAEVSQVPDTIPSTEMNEAVLAGITDELLQGNHDPYFDDVRRAIGEQLQLFDETSDSKGGTKTMTPLETEKQNESGPDGQPNELSNKSVSGGARPFDEVDGGAAAATIDSHAHASVPVAGNEAEGGIVDEVLIEDPLLSKAHNLLINVPILFNPAEHKVRRLYEDLLKLNLRVTVDLPWFANANTVVPTDAWPDHKAIRKFWNLQGSMGLRQANKPAPTTSDFKPWVMQRLRIPQSAWSLGAIFKGSTRVFSRFNDLYANMIAERIKNDDDFDSPKNALDIDYEGFAHWLCKRDDCKGDDEGLGWLFIRAAQLPSETGIKDIFSVVDQYISKGLKLGPKSMCALGYLVDCCEVAIDLVDAVTAKQRPTNVHRKRDPKWQEMDHQTEHAEQEADATSDCMEGSQDQGGDQEHGDNMTNATPVVAAANAQVDQAHPLYLLAPKGEPESTISGLPDLADMPTDRIKQMMLACVNKLDPGSNAFVENGESLGMLYQQLSIRHKAAVQEEELRKKAEADQQAQEAIRMARLSALEVFFAELDAVCASVPEDMLHEPITAAGDAPSCMERLTPLDEDSFNERMALLRKNLEQVKSYAAQMVSKHDAYEALDDGSDPRLAEVSGLARRQLRNRLQEELLDAAREDNHNLVTALQAIVALHGGTLVDTASEGVIEGTAEKSTDGGAHHAPAAADATAHRAEVATAEVTDDSQPLPVKANEMAHEAPAETPMPTLEEPLVVLPENVLSGDEEHPVAAVTAAEPQTQSASAPEVFTSTEQSDVATVLCIDEASPQADASKEDFRQAMAAIAKAAAHQPGLMPVGEEGGIDLAEEVSDDMPGDAAASKTIEVDVQMDAKALLTQERMAPLIRAAEAEYWRLTRVGVAALCAVHPHPVVEIHGAAWTSMLDSLSSLTIPGGEQNINESLMRWLESGASVPGADNGLALALDIGVLGAGLLPILFEGHEAKIRWAVLSRVASRMQEHKPLHELCELLQSLDTTALRITRENLSSSRVAPRKALEAEVQRMRDRAMNWPSDSVLFRNWPNQEYWEMHGAMFDDRHGLHLHKALQHVVRGADDPLRKMMPELQKYVEKMSGTLGDLRKRTGRKRSLEGPHAEKLAQNVHATINFLQSYLDHVARLNNVATGAIPLPLREFLDKLHSKTHAASDYIKTLRGPEDAVLDMHAMLAEQIMQTTLALMNEQAPLQSVPEDLQVLLMEVPMNSSLNPIWTVKLDDEYQETTLRDPLDVLEQVGVVVDELTEAATRKTRIEDLLIDAAEMHRSNNQILAARAIEQRLRAEPAQVQSQMKTANEAAHRRAKTALSEDLADARQRVTNALSVGPMTQAEANHMLKVIEVLDRANRDNNIGVISPVGAPYEDYPQAHALLRSLILVPLEHRIHESLRNLQNEMRTYRAELEQTGAGDALAERKLEQLDRIEAGLREVTPTNIRVARYSFSLLEQDELPVIRLQLGNPVEAYEVFQKELAGFTINRTPLESLRDALRADDAKHWPKGEKPAWAASLDAAQREEAASFLDSWMTLTEARTISEVHEPLADFFLRATGTAEAPTALSEPGNNGRTPFHLSSKTFVGAARLQGFWVPPILGSAARDLRGVILRNRPQPQHMASVIEELPVTTPNLLLGRTRLPLARRAAITRDHPVLIVDDDLVAYMAVHPEQRLAKMMEVGLLTFHDNPYDDYGGPVPHEMFFGRRSELMRLKNNKSALVLYGGRRLGKSSLLDRIQFESRQNLVHTPDGARGEVAIYIPLDSRIDSATFGDDHRLFAWTGIYRGMVNNRFISPAKTEPKTADVMREYIRSEIMAGRSLTDACYLLIDEADDVMARDIEADGAFASSLRGLCDDVRDVCTIRYVIAGLHNLTRMHTEGNTALAKADAIALQPFSSGQDILMGVDLITKPLAALGFMFPKGSEDLPMRILAMCNFYPAFVQLYCKNLIQDLYNKRGQKSPITLVEASDLDKVERNKDFLSVMQEKFRYNLDLDKRYKAIALILADTYYRGTGAGVEQGLAATDIRELCHTFFPNHFSKTGEGAFPALLEEMEKLTVIDRKGSRYQLRTPHIATMMGSYEDVETKIDELQREKPASNRTPGETRPFLTRNNGHEIKPFPMSSGWVRQLLHNEERNLVMMVGNHLCGLSEIEGLKQPWAFGRGSQLDVKYFASIDTARTYVNTIRRLGPNDPVDRIVAVLPRSWKKEQIGEYAAFANSLARPTLTLDQRRMANVRLLFIANPQQAWDLAQMLHEHDTSRPLAHASSKVAQRNWRIDPVPSWTEDAVYFRLKHFENPTLLEQHDACAKILDATLGFGGEINKLVHRGLTLREIEQALEDNRQRLCGRREAFYTAIGWPETIDPELTRQAEDLLVLMDGELRNKTDSWHKEMTVPQSMITFMRWMGLLLEAGDGTWRLPVLYKALISPNKQESK